MKIGERIGARNRDRVEAWFADHIGGTRRECAAALSLSEEAVGRHIKAIRKRWEQRVPATAETGGEDRSAADLLLEIDAELKRARAKFSGDNVTTLALVEEVGELAKATFEERRARVRQEAVQVAVMAMRVVLDGDQSLDAWRKVRGLDPLTDQS